MIRDVKFLVGSRIRRAVTAACTLLMAGVIAGPGRAAPLIISSAFDASSEGWTIVGDGSAPAWVASGGVEGGYISSTDQGQGVFWYFRAPSRFLGNKGSAYGQDLAFSLKQSAIDSQAGSQPDVILKGAGLTLVYDTTPNPGTAWTAYTVRLEATSGWKKDTLTGAAPTETEMRSLLASLSDLQIRGEFRSGADIGGLDSVIMTLGEPGPPISLPAVSTFDTNDEGWTVFGDAQGASVLPTYHPDGGNPGGHVTATDDVAGGVWYWKAPPRFTGNASAAYGSSLSFDLKQSGLNDQFNGTDVVLVGGGLTLVFDTPENPGLNWTHYAIPLSTGAGWTRETLGGTPATEADIRTLLAYLEDIRIRGEFIGGPDTGGLDNAVLGGAMSFYGDADGNGVVEWADVRGALASAAGFEPDAFVTRGDVAPAPEAPGAAFGDGRLTLADALRIARYLSGLEPRWP